MERDECDAVVQSVSRKSVTLAVRETHSSPAPTCPVALVQAVPKGKLIETIIQKATELGAARIIPLLSERVIVQLDEEGAREKAEKWQQVAVEAIKQCGQRWLPQVEPPVTLPALLRRDERFGLSLVGSLRPEARHPREYFKEQPAGVRLWIGPEGDFTNDELAAIQNSGARPINLGPLVLRSDTAAVYALSIISYELQAQPARRA